MITKDGYRIIIYTGILLAVFIILRWFFYAIALDVLIGITLFIFLFHFSFFRDPERKIPGNDNHIVSPADGKVIKIEKVREDQYLKSDAWLISIFMNIFNVHVNRVPISGQVEYLNYKKGKFLVASLDEAMDNNEQMAVGIDSAQGKILFKQIAGLIARRIVCHLKEGERVQRGNRFGMIKYSSRVDIYLPIDTNLKVSLNEKVKAGRSIIGEIKI